MIMGVNELAELHRTPSLNHVSAQSPRVGGCVGTFFHMFDWNPGKKVFTTKRLPADRLEEEYYVRRERSFKESNAKLQNSMQNEDSKREVVMRALPVNSSSTCSGSPESGKSSEDPNKRVPGVVARLMGLESLPKASAAAALMTLDAEEEVSSEGLLHGTEPLSPSPVLLQELLWHEGFRKPRNHLLKEKLPRFSKKLTDQKQDAESPRKKASAVARAQHSGGPYVDPKLPKPPSHRKSQLGATSKQTFLSRLTQCEPILLPSKAHNQLVSSSSMRLSPSSSSSFGSSSKRTAKLLEAAAAKILEPSMHSSSSRLLTSPAQSCRYTQSESGLSINSERQGGGSFSHWRGGSGLYSSSSSSKISRTESMARSWNGKEEQDVGEISGRNSEPGSLKPLRRVRGSAVSYHDLISQKEEQASKWRFQTALAAHAEEAAVLPSPRPPLVRKPLNQASAGVSETTTASSAKHVLGTHEASIRRFKTELGGVKTPKSSTVVAKKGSNNHSRSKSEASDLIMVVHHGGRKAGSKAMQAEVAAATSLRTELSLADHDEIIATKDCSHPNPETTSLSQETAATRSWVEGEVTRLMSSGMGKADFANDSFRSADVAVNKKLSGSGRPPPPPHDGFGHHASLWGLKVKPGKQEKDAGSPGNRVFPIEKVVGSQTDFQQVQPDNVVVPAAAAKAMMTGSGGSFLRYSWPFNLPKPSDKKEGQEKGEGLVLKRPENVFMRSILRRQTAAPCEETGPQKHTAQKTFSTTSRKEGRIQQENGAAQNSMRNAVREQTAGVLQPEAHLVALDTLLSIDSNVVCCENLSHNSDKEETSLALVPNRKFDRIEHSPNMRARSIDEVFPELPMEGSVADMTEKQFLRFDSQGHEKASCDCQSGEKFVFGRSPDIFVTEQHLGLFPSSPLIDYETVFFPEREIHSNLEHLFSMGSDGSNSPFFNREPTVRVTATTQERSNLKYPQEHKKLSAGDIAHGVEADLDTCSTRMNCDTSVTPDHCLEMQMMHVNAGWSGEDDVSPILLQKFNKNSPVSTKILKTAECQLASLSSSVEECGQPSPVSVLESHFLDDSPTTPETSLLIETEQQRDEGGLQEDTSSSSCCGVVSGIQVLDKRQQEEEKAVQLKMGTSQRNEGENIRQALLTISRYYNIDISNIRLEGATSSPVPQQESPQDYEKDYVREILEASRCWERNKGAATRSSRNWVLPQLPVALDHSLFDKLEFGSNEVSEQTRMGSKKKHWRDIAGQHQYQGSGGSSCRCNRKLLFDSMNEALVLQFDCEYCACVEPWMNVQISIRPRSFGPRLVADVYRKLCEWSELADDLVDNLIEQDMSVAGGKWTDFSQEVVEVGLDVERILLKFMIEELVDDVHHLQRGSYSRLSCSLSAEASI